MSISSYIISPLICLFICFQIQKNLLGVIYVSQGWMFSLFFDFWSVNISLSISYFLTSLGVLAFSYSVLAYVHQAEHCHHVSPLSIPLYASPALISKLSCPCRSPLILLAHSSPVHALETDLSLVCGCLRNLPWVTYKTQQDKWIYCIWKFKDIVS